MKRRLLSLALAVSMILGSINAVAAENAGIGTDTLMTEVIDDTVASSGSVEEPNEGISTVENTEVNTASAVPDWAATEPWRATVFGDCGGQPRIDNYGNLSSTDSYPNGDGVYVYNVTEEGSDVNVRMGIPDYNDSTNDKAPAQPQGKIAGSSEGIVYYYREISADEDYTVSATAHINGILNNNSQVSFGATVRDTVVPFDGTNSKLAGDSISAAVLDMDKAGSAESGKAMRFAYYRQGGALTKFDSAKTAAPANGEDIEVSITKAGSMYTLKFGDETATVNADEAGLSFTDDVYVGFFAARCADITFKNVTYKKAGTVEAGEWTKGGNGLFNTDPSKLNSVTLSAENENADISLMLKASGPTGKITADEQSYAYYASQNAAGEDFELSAVINSIDFMPQAAGDPTKFKNQNQAFIGAVVFNNTYGDPKNGNQVLVGLMSNKSASVTADLVAIKYNGSAATPYSKTVIASDVADVGKTMNGPVNLTLKRSGDVLKVTWGEYTADIDISGILTDNQYIGYAVARDGGISVSGNSLTVGTRKVASVEIASMPEKTEYYATQGFDTTGLSFKVTYEDGATEIVSDEADYSLLGFDDSANQCFNTVGEKVVQANVGGVTVDIPVTVRGMKVTAISIDYTPAYDTFYVGGKVNVTGMQVTAEFEDGTSKQLSSNEYKLYLGETEIIPGVTTLTADMASADAAVTVRYTDADEAVDATTAEGTFYVNINPGKLEKLAVKNFPYRTIFYVGEELDTSGLIVSGVYKDGDNESRQVISSDLYEVIGFSSNTVTDKLTLTIQYKEDASIKTTYDIQIKESTPLRKEYESYPRLTYSVNEVFDASGLVMGVNYTNGTTVNFGSDVYYYKDGDTCYKVYANNEYDENGNVIYEKGHKVIFTDETISEFTNADFYVDVTDYDNRAVGTTSIKIYVNAKYGLAAEEPEVWNVSIAEAKDYVWKATIFGASALGVNDQGAGSVITANYTNGKEAEETSKFKSDIKPMLMENGKVNGLDSIKLTSWNGAGKITGSHDGIVYFYTRLNADENFVLSGDVTINRYIADPDNLTDDQKEKYNSYIAAGDSHQVAIDKLRGGQESFGIMARDVIPMAADVKDGVYTGNSNGITEFADDAITKEYTFTKNDGSSVTYSAPVDALEAVNNNIKVVNENGVEQDVKPSSEAPSNIVVGGGISNGEWPKDPNSSTYNKYTQINRINLAVRYDGKKRGYYSTTTKLPEKGEKYNIQLSMTNTGYKLTTYNYQTDTTNTQYFYDNVEETSNVLKTKDSDNFYVGFYAARWADVTVSNVELHQTNTVTEQNKNGSVEETVKPKISISSPYYTTSSKYTLIMKTNSGKYDPNGIASISLNGKNIYSDVVIGGKSRNYDAVLKEDSVNNFSVVYYPNTADTNLSSYDPVITRFTVTHKSRNEINDMKNIYVAPNGTLSGDGTRNNPLTLEAGINLLDTAGKVIMLDGTYNLTNEYLGKISIGDSLTGMKGSPKSLEADEGANPVIDLQEKYGGFEVSADYWYFKGFSVINSKDSSTGFTLGGNHCIIENCTFADNGTTGMQISRVASSNDYIYYWPQYNLIKGCESYNNCDPSMGNADGFAAKLTVGYGNVFEDCISHHNVDDGWDLYTKLETGSIGPVVLENCITYRNGYKLDEASGTDQPYSEQEGNGFKMGGESIYVEHMLKDCVAFENYNSGVTSNNNPAMKLRNVISYKNAGGGINLYSGSTEILADGNGSSVDEKGRPYKFNYDIKGVVSYGSNGGDSIGSWNKDTGFGNISTTPIESESNYIAKTGNVGINSEGISVDPSEFFVSTDKSEVLGSNMRYSRNADGSFDHGDYLARVTPYVHEADDIVTLPDMNGGEGGVGVVTTETTTESSEVTTSKTSSGGGSGAGGSLKTLKYETTTAADTREEVTVSENTTEETTSYVFTDSVSVQVGSTDITINESRYSMDTAPYIQAASNSTMVPLRFVSVALAGGNVSEADASDIIVWDAATKTAEIRAGGNTIVFTAGSGTYTVNGAEMNISNQAAAEIVEGRMFVPFRTIGEALGAEVSWDTESKTAMYN